MSYLLNYNPGTRQYVYPRRGGAQISGTAIIHTAECAADNDGEDLAAETCARFIANRADYGSYHRLVDSDSIIELLPWEYEAWQDSETNNWAVGISAALRTTDWLTMPADRADRVYRNMAACAADFVRYMAGKGVTVPLRRITGAEARARVPGFCAHGDSGLHRSDPGANFDWSKFFNYTQAALTGTYTEEDDMFTDADRQAVIDARNEATNAKLAAQAALQAATGLLQTRLPDPANPEGYQPSLAEWIVYGNLKAGGAQQEASKLTPELIAAAVTKASGEVDAQAIADRLQVVVKGA